MNHACTHPDTTLQVDNQLDRYNAELVEVARSYKTRVSGHHNYVPWLGEGAEDENLLTQFVIPTHGATTPTNNIELFQKTGVLFARCALCTQDINLSQRVRVAHDKITTSSLLHIAQHAACKAHQQAKLAYLRGIRDTLKHIAHKGLSPHAYTQIVKDCHRIETVQRDVMRNPCTTAPGMITEGGPTPSTTKNLTTQFASFGA
jgi:hypothetical protein